MTYTYTTQGTCSRTIEIEIENDTICDVRFIGGCHGNLQGIGALVRGLEESPVVSPYDGKHSAHHTPPHPSFRRRRQM